VISGMCPNIFNEGYKITNLPGNYRIPRPYCSNILVALKIFLYYLMPDPLL
jgi:hypothetical protein